MSENKVLGHQVELFPAPPLLLKFTVGANSIASDGT